MDPLHTHARTHRDVYTTTYGMEWVHSTHWPDRHKRVSCQLSSAQLSCPPTYLKRRRRPRGRDGGVEPVAVGVNEDVEDEVEDEEGRHQGIVEGVLAQEVGELGVAWSRGVCVLGGGVGRRRRQERERESQWLGEGGREGGRS